MHNLWNTLSEAKLVEGEMPSSKEEHTPWYVQILLAFSGWLAAIFMLGFLFAAFQRIFDNTTTLFILGTIMIVFSYIILKKEKNNFIEHLGLAISFAGQSLILFALFKIFDHYTTSLWLCLLALQTILALLMPNYIHRLFSSFFAASSFLLLCSTLQIAHSLTFLLLAVLTYLFLSEFSKPSMVKKKQALGYGLVLSLILIENTSILEESMRFWRHHNANDFSLWFPPYLSLIVDGLVVLYVVLKILKQHQIPSASKVGIVSILSILFFTILGFEMPGLILGILIVILAFNHSNRVLLGLGIFSLLFSASSYYYLLADTLLHKSLLLALLGLVLLVGRWIVFHLLLSEKKVTHV